MTLPNYFYDWRCSSVHDDHFRISRANLLDSVFYRYTASFKRTLSGNGGAMFGKSTFDSIQGCDATSIVLVYHGEFSVADVPQVIDLRHSLIVVGGSYTNDM